LGPIKERGFIVVGGINDTLINSNLPRSHRCNNVGISCPRLPHERPSSPTIATTHTIIVKMVTSPIEPTNMDEDEYEVLLVNPKRTFKSLTKATIKSSIDENYANCPSP
jgi:hypothetical protein